MGQTRAQFEVTQKQSLVLVRKTKCLASNPSRLQTSNNIHSFFIIQYLSSYTVVLALWHFWNHFLRRLIRHSLREKKQRLYIDFTHTFSYAH